MAAIDVRRVREGDDVALRALGAVRAETERELNPTDPPPPVAELAADLFVPWSREARAGWVATVDGEPAGELYVVLESAPNERTAAVEWMGVVPRHRRRGVASALLRAALGDADLAGRSSVTFAVPVLPDRAGIAFAERVGATMRLVERCSRLRVAEVPEDTLARWLAEGRGRVDGYRLVQWVGPVPDEHVGLLVAVRRAMDDMPVDGLDVEVPVLDEADVRSFGESTAARGLRPVMTAVVAPDGSPAGFSALFLDGHRPQLAWQGDTGVLAGHRGRGLGRWSKAENLELAVATEPRLEVIETFNAESNPWMLDINVAMGFRPHLAHEIWQADRADVEGAVGAAVSAGGAG